MNLGIASALVAPLVVIVTAISAGISQGLTNRAAFKAIDIQPEARDPISRLALLSSALIETTAILGVFIGLLLVLPFLRAEMVADAYYSDLAQIGIAVAMVCTGLCIGIFSSWPAQEACYATARQPFHAQWIFNFTLIVLSVIQTPLILAFIVSIFIKSQANAIDSLPEAFRLIGAGCAIGLGSIGPAFGLAHFARVACQGISRNRNASTRILTFTFISQAIIESPVIFSMVISLLLLFGATATTLTKGIAMLAAGIGMGLGTLGPGISSGRTAAAACKEIARDPELYSQLARSSIFAQGIIDTAAIYVLLTSALIILFV